MTGAIPASGGRNHNVVWRVIVEGVPPLCGGAFDCIRSAV